MKKYLTILLLLPLLFANSALAYDATLSNTITVGGYSYTVGAQLDSITVNANDFSVVLSRDAYITVTSSDRKDFTVSPSAYKKSLTCGDSQSVLEVGNNDGTVTTVTITPSSSTCSSGGGGSPSSGGGGGGGGVPTPVYQVIPGTSSSVVSTVATTAVSPSVSSSAFVFTKTIRLGMTNSEVKKLQQILNSDSDTRISTSGVGSPGNETEYFGSLTRTALKKFQAKYGIASSGSEDTTGYGMVGPSTRRKLSEISSGITTPSSDVVPASSAQTTSIVSSVVFTKGLSKGVSGSDVKVLQQILNSDPDTRIANSGAGSPGNESEYFGSMTEKAVQKFQVKYGIASPSDSGYGYLGPKTRAKLNEIFGRQ